MYFSSKETSRENSRCDGCNKILVAGFIVCCRVEVEVEGQLKEIFVVKIVKPNDCIFGKTIIEGPKEIGCMAWGILSTWDN
jgi:hypothetical protein